MKFEQMDKKKNDKRKNPEHKKISEVKCPL